MLPNSMSPLTSNALVGDGLSIWVCDQLHPSEKGVSCRTLIQHVHPVCFAPWHLRCSQLPTVTLPSSLDTP